MHSYENLEDENKNILIYIFPATSIIGFLIFGLIFDYYKFKPLIKAISFIEILMPLMMIFCKVNVFSYYIIILISFFIFGGNLVLLFSELMKIYGILSGIEILSLNSVLVGIINLIMFFLNKFVLKEDFHFIIIYAIGGVILIGKFITLFFLKENVIFFLLNSNQDTNQNVENSF